MDFADLALRALQVLSPVLLAALTWLAARAAALISAPVEGGQKLSALRLAIEARNPLNSLL